MADRDQTIGKREESAQTCSIFIGACCSFYSSVFILSQYSTALYSPGTFMEEKVDAKKMMLSRLGV